MVPSSFVAAHYLKHTLKVTGKVFLIGQQGFLEEMSLQGIEIIGTGVGFVLMLY